MRKQWPRGLPGADDLLEGPSAQHGIDSTDEDGLTGTGLAREDMEALLKINGGLTG